MLGYWGWKLTGRDLFSGLPRTIMITSTDVNHAIADSLNQILKVLKLTLEQTPPELAADIMENGIVLSGGVSLLKNLDRYLSDDTGIPVFVAENPLDSVVRGVGSTLENMEVLKKIVKTKKR